jgi:ParB-like chromosome segregation protein Spo0J
MSAITPNVPSNKPGTQANDALPEAGRLVVDYRAIDSLIPYVRNARTHTSRQVAGIAASIREFGWTNPVLVDGENGIIAGHGRVLAARMLGLARIPVIELAGLTPAQKRAYVIADNRLALDAGWDTELLALEFADLSELGFDLALTGFGEEEIAALSAMGSKGLTDPDDVPALAPAPVSRMGDLWCITG